MLPCAIPRFECLDRSQLVDVPGTFGGDSTQVSALTLQSWVGQIFSLPE